MFTPFKHDRGLTTNTGRPTDSTVVICIEPCIQLIVLKETFLIQTGQTTFFISEPFTSVTAVKNFFTALCHKLYTTRILTNVFERKTLLVILFLHFVLTKAAF